MPESAIPTESHSAAIEACYACADACDRCAIACLQEADPRAMARCIALDMDCAQACRLAAGFMARGSASDHTACAFCAGLCDQCADECEQHPMEHCRACAQACRLCAGLCRRMADHRARPTTAAGTHARH
ncbi:four-helix bundle copper-binding protein [Aquabacterium sp. A7-Y]|uniref:four-helix bundle copper-binding protein n=1 Tax=Aquabacterium sp. A7-Y TaxID=1349605 RepID=UPI00223E37A9|nr:four-helix bundle copper-binding protein [Aquabacterium sp. A7-Y]MCW7539242.1 four-helix bundle copper-binding protein [Aquabacterium sp. A7-Y]